MAVPRTVDWLLVAAGALVSVVSGHIEVGPSRTNEFLAAYVAEIVGVPLGGLAAGFWLARRRARAAAMLGVGVYLLIVAGVMGSLFAIWLPEDNTILGTALVAGLLAGVGATLGLASVQMLADAARPREWPLAVLGGVLAFLVVTAGGLVYPLAQIRLPVAAAVVASFALLAFARRRLVGKPLLWTLAGSLATIAILVLRGPDDWASASTSVKLYSAPVLVMALGISRIILGATETR